MLEMALLWSCSPRFKAENKHVRVILRDYEHVVIFSPFYVVGPGRLHRLQGFTLEILKKSYLTMGVFY
jgi:hypothetical protein